MYDYIIIGAGPGGLNCSLYLSKIGYKVALIESLEDVGGCHRVRYTTNKAINKYNEVHTEHGPRIYLGAYLNFWIVSCSRSMRSTSTFEPRVAWQCAGYATRCR